MSVKVNLLPEASRRDSAKQQQQAIAAGSLALLLVALGGAWVWQDGRIDTANEQLAAAQAELATHQSRELELAPYSELEAEATATVDRVEAALGAEVSVAGVLQDIAAVFPAGTEMSSLAVDFGAPKQPALGGERPIVGTMAINGLALDGHAPGVEGLLLRLDALAALDSSYATSSTTDEETGVATFAIQAEFGSEVRTQRYVDLDLEDLS